MTEPHQTRRFKEALARVQHLFTETDGVKLTTADAALKAGLDAQVCQLLLRNLIESGFLEQRPGGMFVQSTAKTDVAKRTIR